ncbi:nuclear envelope phosphatase-regulatory subunit 1-like [Paramacrobiotus metropolitanus]|uniref:nuclear envelope phosphatase-regulatory subunit 1-like n=1 Tax=Paramacrobiotus metropolitanus TaxID=2943436 RepID=UPI0024463DB2|nr:nuclear envelope phosphatase-regulatory subunit 1-like [Paramacrobiotus metropolitanus]
MARKPQNYVANIRARGDRNEINTEQNVFDDLKAFESRMMEIVACPRSTTRKWQMVLALASVFTVISTARWLLDPLTQQVSFWQSLLNHPGFVLCTLILTILFLTGIHHRVVASSIISARVKTVLKDFNMSCDTNGKLILKPRSGIA